MTRSSTSVLLSSFAFPDILEYVSTRRLYVAVSGMEVVNPPHKLAPYLQVLSIDPPHNIPNTGSER